MTPEYVAVARDATSAEAIAAIRRLVDEAETVNYVYVVDERATPPGRALAVSPAPQPGDTPVERAHGAVDGARPASRRPGDGRRLLTDRNLLAIPVVDDDDHLIGIITEDDVADVIEAEATEDIERLGGRQPLNLPVPARRACRCWSASASAGCSCCSSPRATRARCSRTSEGELAAVVALSFFIPLLIGTGGNVGSQTVTLVVRAMALGEVALRDIGWLVFKELRVGLVDGPGDGRRRPFGQAVLLGVSADIAHRRLDRRSSRSASGPRPWPRRCR